MDDFTFLNSNLTKQFDCKVNSNMDVGHTTMYFDRNYLIDNFSKYEINITPMENHTNIRSCISNNSMFGQRTIVQTNISTIDMVEFAKSQTALYVGVQMFSACDVVFDIKSK